VRVKSGSSDGDEDGEWSKGPKYEEKDRGGEGGEREEEAMGSVGGSGIVHMLIAGGGTWRVEGEGVDGGGDGWMVWWGACGSCEEEGFGRLDAE